MKFNKYIKHILLFLAGITVVILIVFGIEYNSQGIALAQDGHEEHDHEEHDKDNHEEGTHDDEEDDHEGHNDSTEEKGDSHIELTEEQIKRIGLKTKVAGPGNVSVSIEFPGELILNPDREVHIVPRASGIVRKVKKTLGDRVKADEILAWIESSELTEAKLDYFAKQAEVGCCLVELPRAQAIFNNTNKLLILLSKEPDAKELEKLHDLEMGAYHGILSVAYTEYRLSKTNYEREKQLHANNASSEKELLEAEGSFRKAQAKLHAAMDTARFDVLIGFSEAAQQRQVAEFEAVAAEKKLLLLGVEKKTVEMLKSLVPKIANLEPCVCDDPNCEDDEIPSVLESLGKEEGLGLYALRSPISGIITEKHISVGEKVGDEDVFTISDTTSVWARFEVFQKNLLSVKPGQKAHIYLGHGMPHLEGEIAYLSPVLNEETRTAQGRIVLDNPEGLLKPGLYATVQIAVKSTQASVAIPKDAVLMLDEKNVVFIREGDGFKPISVQLGLADQDLVVIKDGLQAGQEYVTDGAFELKAKIVTGGLDSHAGHGH